MWRRTQRSLDMRALAMMVVLWVVGPGSARAGEILWQYDTGG